MILQIFKGLGFNVQYNLNSYIATADIFKYYNHNGHLNNTTFLAEGKTGMYRAAPRTSSITIPPSPDVRSV
jgi:hypothetical protein